MNLLAGRVWTRVPLLFLSESRHRLPRNPYLYVRTFEFQVKDLDESLRKQVMGRLNSFFRSTRCRLGRRLAQFVAIAAESLPLAGA